MDHFNYQNDQLFAEQVRLADIATEHGTPCYVYSRATIERHWHAFDRAAGSHPHLICYAVKANSNLAILQLLAHLGSGFDIVSGGELARVLEAGGDPGKVVFSGVAKSEQEIRFALENNIMCFNLESPAELERVNRIAQQMGKQAPISIRVNPDVDANTHPYISTGLKANKFGIEAEQAIAIYQRANQLDGVKIVGMDCHIGSQLTDVAPFLDALSKLLKLVDQLAELGIDIQHLDVGGGLGVSYQGEQPPQPQEYAEAMLAMLKGRETLTLIFEPGRAIMANAGVLLTQVEFTKQGGEKNFVIVDAAMNDLLRPALYQAWQDIVPLDRSLERTTDIYDVVGPVCETGDFLGKDRRLGVAEGDLLAVKSAGAYGFVMASNYNSRPRAAEVLVDKDNVILIRERENIKSLWKGEHKLT